MSLSLWPLLEYQVWGHIPLKDGIICKAYISACFLFSEANPCKALFLHIPWILSDFWHKIKTQSAKEQIGRKVSSHRFTRHLHWKMSSLTFPDMDFHFFSFLCCTVVVAWLVGFKFHSYTKEFHWPAWPLHFATHPLHIPALWTGCWQEKK